tara:strand:+ start:1810 stop:2034 length:225 start_codon:yes stop_codon:yes gene_type:complete
MDNKKDFNKILKTINQLEKDLRKFNCDVNEIQKQEKKRIIKYCNLCKRFHNNKYNNNNNIPTNNKKFKNLFCVC